MNLNMMTSFIKSQIASFDKIYREDEAILQDPAVLMQRHGGVRVVQMFLK